MKRVLLSLIAFYKTAISPLTPPSCRFEPSCSTYAHEAIRLHGSVRGSWLTVRRVARCHPWGGFGFDPVPPVHVSDRSEEGGPVTGGRD